MGILKFAIHTRPAFWTKFSARISGFPRFCEVSLKDFVLVMRACQDFFLSIFLNFYFAPTSRHLRATFESFSKAAGLESLDLAAVVAKLDMIEFEGGDWPRKCRPRNETPEHEP